MSEIIPHNSDPNELPQEVLGEYFGFYQGLSEKGKRLFLKRVKRFIKLKDFEFFFDPGPHEHTIKTLIASSCIMLTWGLRDKYIDVYSYIGIYPDALLIKRARSSSFNALRLEGRSNERWNNLKEETMKAVNHRPVGLVEWTGALIVQARKDNILDDFFSAYYKVWCEAARDIMFVVDEDEHLPLDSFGQKLPVIIQHFFENPAELQANHPEMYEETKKLLNLDLLSGPEHDYIYARKLAKEKKLKTSNRALIFGVQGQVRKFRLPAAAMYYILWQIPIVIAIWFLFGRWTYSSTIFWSTYITLAVVGAFLLYKLFYVRRGLAANASMVLYLIGFLPLLYSSMIILNYAIPVKRKIVPVLMTRPTMADNYLPWQGFTTPIVKSAKIIKRYQVAGEEPNVEEQILTGNHRRNAIFLMQKDDEAAMHLTTGIFGADVFHGYEVVMKK